MIDCTESLYTHVWQQQLSCEWDGATCAVTFDPVKTSDYQGLSFSDGYKRLLQGCVLFIHVYTYSTHPLVLFKQGQWGNPLFVSVIHSLFIFGHILTGALWKWNWLYLVLYILLNKYRKYSKLLKLEQLALSVLHCTTTVFIALLLRLVF